MNIYESGLNPLNFFNYYIKNSIEGLLGQAVDQFEPSGGRLLDQGINQLEDAGRLLLDEGINQLDAYRREHAEELVTKIIVVCVVFHIIGYIDAP